MDPLAADPRTASIEGDKGARRQLAKVADRLFAALRPDERASWVVRSAGLSPGCGVLTEQRLHLIPMSAGQPVRSVDRPFTIRLKKKGLMGQAMTVTDSRGLQVELLLQPSDFWRLQEKVGTHAPSATPDPPRNELVAGASDDVAVPPPPAGSMGAWRWGRPIAEWRDAELMAGAHMTHLGFVGVTVTQGTGDGGLDAVAEGAAAQVKHHAAPTGSPDIQRLFGAAASFTNRLFYATSYTPTALAEAKRLSVALFVFTAEGLVVPSNDVAEAITPTQPAPNPEVFGKLTIEARQNRAVRWAKQIQDATATPISDRRGKGARQLAQRQQALTLMLQGLQQLEDSDNPLYKQRRKKRTLTEAETTLKKAAWILRIRLK